MDSARWQEIKAALQQALELEPATRAKFLTDVGARDPQLREELDSLLDSYDDAAFLETPAACLSTFQDLHLADPWIGRPVGAYRLLERIGSGGMGEVYRAVRADGEFDKQVAIKLIRAGQDSWFVIRRFRSERQILAGLDHPNIAKLLDGGRTAEGLPYFVMELIAGQPIDAYCRNHGLDVTARLRLVLKVCAAVQYAHQRLIVHRDLKPTNILVDEEGTPKLLDFGIAKIIGTGALQSPPPPGSATQSMIRLGTPGYASPEQMRGEPITTASDVYSLGLMLHELTTGRRPVVSDLADLRKPSAVVRHAGPVDGAPEASPAKLARRLRGDLDNILLTALRHDPRRRYDSVERLAEDLRRHLASQPIVARPDTLGYRAAKFVARYRLGVAAACVIAVGLIAGQQIARREARVAEAQRARAELRFNDVRRLAHSLIFDLDDSIENVAGATQAKHLLVKTGLRYLDDLSREAAGDTSLQRELASAYERLGDVQGRALEANEGDYAGAERSYRHALELRRLVLAAEPGNTDVRRELIVNCGKLSDLMWTSGNADAAMEFSRRTVAESRLLAGADAQSVKYRYLLASGLLDYGYKLYTIRGDSPHAMEQVRQALGIFEQLYAANPGDARIGRSLSLGYDRAAQILAKDSADPTEALAMARSAEELLGRLWSAAPSNVDLAHLHAFSEHDLAGLLAQSGDLAAANERERAALQGFKSLAKSDPAIAEYRIDQALALAGLAELAMRAGQPLQAVELFREALRTGDVPSSGGAFNAYFVSARALQNARLGNAWAVLAADPRARAEVRTERWHAAKTAYAEAMALYLRLPAASGSAAGAAAMRDALSSCDTALKAIAEPRPRSSHRSHLRDEHRSIAVDPQRRLGALGNAEIPAIELERSRAGAVQRRPAG